MTLSRRDFLTIGAPDANAAVIPGSGVAETPKRGGTLTIRA
jgi:hypothetical protein